MRHLSDGTLRRLGDEPQCVSDLERNHYNACEACRARGRDIASNARAAAYVLGSTGAVDTAAGWNVLQRRIALGDVRTDMTAPWRRRRAAVPPMLSRQGRGTRLIVAFAGAAALVSAVAVTPVGSLAQSLITIFEPRQFVSVPITSTDMTSLQSLPDLRAFGTVSSQTHPRMQEFLDRDRAGRAFGAALLASASTPRGVPATPRYTVMSATTGTFRFNASTTRNATDVRGKALPSLPAGLAGSALQVTLGPVALTTYGGQFSGAGPSTESQRHHPAEWPVLMIAQAALPRVQSTGATVRQIEDYLTRLPGVSPQLAREIRAIGDPTTALPIPIPVDRVTAQVVRVHGVDGLAVGDNTGVGSGVIWREGGEIFGVAGALPESAILRFADSLR